jgi:UPF0755 protein
MARWIAAGLLLIAAAALVAAGAFQYLKIRFERPGPLAAETVIVIPKGAGLASIAGQLEAAGIVDDANIFRLGVRFLDLSRSLQAGEFAFVAGITMRETAETIAAGKTVLHRLTAPEGETTKTVLDLLEATPILTGPVPSSLAEGELLPETYYFSRGDTRAQVAERMRRSMTELLAELWPERAEGLPLPTPRAAVILASIVEKETGLPEERPLIAGVFINRLRKPMRLQSDPTVTYGITLGQAPLGRLLTRADLNKPTPYNTYQIDGLPPGPIANPGRKSLEAVLHPAATDYLYFVADGTGGHAFAKTLKEHQKNVAKWRKVQRSQRSNAD